MTGPLCAGSSRSRRGRTMNMRTAVVVTMLLGSGSLASSAMAQDWPSWRGPDENGMARGDAPLTWSDSDGVTWRAAIPGRGHSAPVVWGNQIFVTTAVPVGSQARSDRNGSPRGRGPSAGGGVHPTGGGGAGRFPSGRGRGGMRSPHGDSGPQSEHRFVLLSIDRSTGEVLWSAWRSRRHHTKDFTRNTAVLRRARR